MSHPLRIPNGKQMKKRKWTYIIGGLLIAISVGLWLLNRPFSAPSVSDVTSIRVELYNLPDGGADIPEFEVPKAYYQTILSSLDGSPRDNFPPKWQILGQIRITLTTSSILVNLFWTRHESGAFSSNGSYYRGASDTEFIQLGQAAGHFKSQPVGGNNSDSLPATR